MISSRPRRLNHPAPVGSLLKRINAPAPRKPAGNYEDPGYLALVRQCPCLHCGMEPSEAAHVRFASAAYGKASGLQRKPEDKWALPLCAEHHRLDRVAQHNRGEEAFWAELGISPLLTAERLYAQRGDLVAMRAVIIRTISERGT